MIVNVKYNFVQYKSPHFFPGFNFYKYYDNEAVLSLTIFNSGWKGLYQCVEEWGEYGNSEYHLYTSEEIFKIYGIKTFSRKEKLKKINASIL